MGGVEGGVVIPPCHLGRLQGQHLRTGTGWDGVSPAGTARRAWRRGPAGCHAGGRG